MIPLKIVQQIPEDVLPEPFKSYWFKTKLTNDTWRNEWKFYLVEGVLYLKQDKDDEILIPWWESNCAGVACFVMDLKKKGEVFPILPWVRTNGEYLFELRRTTDYELSAFGQDGRKMVVYDG